MTCGCTHMYSQPAILHDEAFSASGSAVCVYVGVTTVEQCNFSALSHIAHNTCLHVLALYRRQSANIYDSYTVL